ncbi:MAG: hypothetical protein ACK44D_05810 [Bacteroidia bacterium]
MKDIEIPTAPGFILLDQAPSSIERPNSPKAFAVSALNSFTESNGLPKNYAVEFTPFWFFKHPKMNVLKYAGYNDKTQRPFSSIKMVSLSMAYINQLDSISLSPTNNISIGARTNILKVRSKNNLKAIVNANTVSVNHLKRINELIVDRIGPADPIDPEGYKKKHLELLMHFKDSLKNEISVAHSMLSDALIQKPVFAVDFAIAYNTFFTNNNFSTQQFGRLGTWLTLNYAQKLNNDNSNYLNLYAIGRFLQDGTNKNNIGEFVTQDFYDFGGKIELELDKFSIGYEYIFRSNNKAETYRSSGQLKYRIADNVLLTGAFGKNFGDNNNLISMLGINWGISTGNEKARVN